MVKPVVRPEVAGRTLKDLENLTTKKDLDTFLQDLNTAVEEGKYVWKFLDDNQNNMGQVNQIPDPESGILENTSNAMDAVIKYFIEVEGLGKTATTPEEVIREKLEALCIEEYQESEEYQDASEEVRSEVLREKLETLNIRNLQNAMADTKNPYVYHVVQTEDEYHCYCKAKNAPCVTYDIRDRGTGLEWDTMVSTLLTIGSSSKTRDPRFVGKYGQGGSTVYPHVSHEGATMYITQHYKTPDFASFTLVRGEDNEDSDFRLASYVYLADAETGHPVVVQNTGTFGHGTLVRHLGYKLDKRDLTFYSSGGRQKESLYATLSSLMVDPVFPIRIYDERDHSSDRMRRNTRSEGSGQMISGALPRIIKATTEAHKKGSTNKIEYMASHDICLSDRADKDLGQITLHVAVASHHIQKGKTATYIYHHVNGGQNGQFYLSGQAIVPVTSHELMSRLPFHHLRNYLLVYVGLDNVSGPVLSRIVQGSRDSLVRGFLDTCYDTLADHLRDDEMLAYYNEERRRRGTFVKAEKSILDRLAKEFKNLFPGGSRPKKGVGPHVPPRIDIEQPAPILYEDPPTFFKLKKDVHRVYPNQRTFTLGFTSDATPTYLNTEGALSFQVWSSSDSFVDVTRVRPYAKSTLKGHGTCSTFALSSDMQVGDKVLVQATLHDLKSGKELSTSHCTIRVAKKPVWVKEPLVRVPPDIMFVDHENGHSIGLTDPERHVAHYTQDPDTQQVTIRVASYAKHLQELVEGLRKDNRGAPSEDSFETKRKYLENEYLFMVAREVLSYYESAKETSSPLSAAEEDRTTHYEERIRGAASAASKLLWIHRNRYS